MSKELSDLLFNAINEQGYLFQEACKYALERSEDSIGWEVKAYEYPVSLKGQDTRIDLVLRSKTSTSPEIYALVECKRVDPSYVHWLFGAPGLPFGNALCSALGVECSQSSVHRPNRYDCKVTRLHFEINTHGAESWLEVKTNTSKRTSTPQNIENSFIQVLKGIGGFANEQTNQRSKGNALCKTFFIPIVITTAKLYVAYYELGNINLYNGKIDKDDILFGSSQGQPAEEDPWVLIDYYSGGNITPESIPLDHKGVDPAELQKYKIRSIFIVNSSHLVEFFSKLQLVL